jgi:hypothetical protein
MDLAERPAVLFPAFRSFVEDAKFGQVADFPAAWSAVP